MEDAERNSLRAAFRTAVLTRLAEAAAAVAATSGRTVAVGEFIPELERQVNAAALAARTGQASSRFSAGELAEREALAWEVVGELRASLGRAPA